MDGEICVPVLVNDIPVIALVDGGASFSSLDKKLCEANKILVKAYRNLILAGLAV